MSASSDYDPIPDAGDSSGASSDAAGGAAGERSRSFSSMDGELSESAPDTAGGGERGSPSREPTHESHESEGDRETKADGSSSARQKTPREEAMPARLAMRRQLNSPIDRSFSDRLAIRDVLSIEGQLASLRSEVLPSRADLEGLLGDVQVAAQRVADRELPLAVRLLRRGSLSVQSMSDILSELSRELIVCGFPRCEQPFNLVPRRAVAGEADSEPVCRTCGYPIGVRAGAGSDTTGRQAASDTVVDVPSPSVDDDTMLGIEAVSGGETQEDETEALSPAVASDSVSPPAAPAPAPMPPPPDSQSSGASTVERKAPRKRPIITYVPTPVPGEFSVRRPTRSGAAEPEETKDAVPVDDDDTSSTNADTEKVGSPDDEPISEIVAAKRREPAAAQDPQPRRTPSDLDIPLSSSSARLHAAVRLDEKKDLAGPDASVAAPPPAAGVALARSTPRKSPPPPPQPQPPPPPRRRPSEQASTELQAPAERPKPQSVAKPPSRQTTPAAGIAPLPLMGHGRESRDPEAVDGMFVPIPVRPRAGPAKRSPVPSEQETEEGPRPPFDALRPRGAHAPRRETREPPAVDVQRDSQGTQTHDSHDSHDSHDTRETRETRDTRDTRDTRELPPIDARLDAHERVPTVRPEDFGVSADTSRLVMAVRDRKKSRRWAPPGTRTRTPTRAGTGTSTESDETSDDPTRRRPPPGPPAPSGPIPTAAAGADSQPSIASVGVPFAPGGDMGMSGVGAGSSGLAPAAGLSGHEGLSGSDPGATTVIRGGEETTANRDVSEVGATELGQPSVLRTLRMRWGVQAKVDLKPSRTQRRRLALPEGDDQDVLGPKRRYAVDRLLARGGMGAILIARDADLRRHIAVKLLPDGDRTNPAVRERFVSEAQVTGQLEHPNIVPVHDIGIDERGRPYYTMKLLKTTSLGSILDDIRLHRHAAHLRYSQNRLLQIFLKVCDGVAYAHSRGVIHRDLKPDNIMIGEFGEVTIIDWGLAKIVGSGTMPADRLVTSDRIEGGVSNTVHGAIAGTPAYMPPEQARGQVDRLSQCSDIYSLGAILYEILTHVRAFDGRDVNKVLVRVKAGSFLPPSDRTARTIPRELEAVVVQAMALEAEDRYSTVEELRQEIEHYIEGRMLLSVSYNPAQRVAKWVRRHKLAAAGMLLVFAAVLATFIVLRVVDQNERETRIRNLLAAAATGSANHDYDGAWRAYLQVLTLDPNNADAHKGANEASRLAAEATAREEALEEAVNLQEIAIDHYRAGEYQEAYDAFVRVLALDPTRDDLEVQIRDCALRVADDAAARAIQNASTEAVDTAKEARRLAALIYDARRDLNDLQGNNPSHTQQLRQIRAAQLTHDELEVAALVHRAVRWYREVITLSQIDDEPALKAIGELYFDLYRWALAWGDGQLVDRTLLALREAIDEGDYARRYEPFILAPRRVTLGGFDPPNAEAYLFRFYRAHDGRQIPIPYSCEKQVPRADPMSRRYPVHTTLQQWRERGSVYDLNTDTLPADQGYRIDTYAAEHAATLPVGSYLLVVSATGRYTIRVPFVIDRPAPSGDADSDIGALPPIELPKIWLPPLDAAPNDFVVISPGRMRYGGDSNADSSGALEVRDILEPFALARYEVTVGEYAEFLDALLFLSEVSAPEEAARLLAEIKRCLPHLGETDSWSLATDEETGRQSIDSRGADPHLAIAGVSFDSATAYARWRAERDQLDFRLPNEVEWEWAARGADGRSYPWGDAFNASWCLMVDSGHGPTRLEPMGQYRNLYFEDESVFGVLDMAGSVREWTASFFHPDERFAPRPLFVLRGGASEDGASDCRVAGRVGLPRDHAGRQSGFRLALDLTLPVDDGNDNDDGDGDEGPSDDDDS